MMKEEMGDFPALPFVVMRESATEYGFTFAE